MPFVIKARESTTPAAAEEKRGEMWAQHGQKGQGGQEGQEDGAQEGAAAAAPTQVRNVTNPRFACVTLIYFSFCGRRKCDGYLIISRRTSFISSRVEMRGTAVTGHKVTGVFRT